MDETMNGGGATEGPAQVGEPYEGWFYHNPDTGYEWSPSHPVESGEVEDATDIRPATARELKDALLQAWSDLEDARDDLSSTPASPAPAPSGAERDDRLWWFLKIIEGAGGNTNASDGSWNWINSFCEDRGNDTDTFNIASGNKLISVSHDSDTDHSEAYITDAGRKYVAEFSALSAPIAEAVRDDGVREALEAAREQLLDFAREVDACAWFGDPDYGNTQLLDQINAALATPSRAGQPASGETGGTASPAAGPVMGWKAGQGGYAREAVIVETEQQIVEIGVTAEGRIDLIVHQALESGGFDDRTARLSPVDAARVAAALNEAAATPTAVIHQAALFVARDCAICCDQPTVPFDCPACKGRGGFGPYPFAPVVYVTPTTPAALPVPGQEGGR